MSLMGFSDIDFLISSCLGLCESVRFLPFSLRRSTFLRELRERDLLSVSDADRLRLLRLETTGVIDREWL